MLCDINVAYVSYLLSLSSNELAVLISILLPTSKLNRTQNQKKTPHREKSRARRSKVLITVPLNNRFHLPVRLPVRLTLYRRWFFVLVV